MLALAVPLAALVAACGGGRDSFQKQLDELRADVVRTRAEAAALGERLDAMERAAGGGSRGAGGVDAAGARPGQPAQGDRPELDVVRLSPDGGGEADALGSRTVIRSGSGGAVVEDTIAAPAKAGGGGPQKELDKALELYRAKAYDKAIEALSAFLSKYPDHPGAEVAAFTRAEAFFARTETRKAAAAFEEVVTRYPQGAKAPDALYRLVQTYTRLNDKAGAEQAKKRLVAGYPSSDAAKKLEARKGEKKQ